MATPYVRASESRLRMLAALRVGRIPDVQRDAVTLTMDETSAIAHLLPFSARRDPAAGACSGDVGTRPPSA